MHLILGFQTKIYLSEIFFVTKIYGRITIIITPVVMIMRLVITVSLHATRITWGVMHMSWRTAEMMLAVIKINGLIATVNWVVIAIVGCVTTVI